MSRLLPACLCVGNFRSRRGSGDWLDEWLVGYQFEPNNLLLSFRVLAILPGRALHFRVLGLQPPVRRVPRRP
jgi:hypothetical protein